MTAYDDAVAEYKAAEEALKPWADNYGPADVVEAAEQRFAKAQAELARLAAARATPQRPILEGP